MTVAPLPVRVVIGCCGTPWFIVVYTGAVAVHLSLVQEREVTGFSAIGVAQECRDDASLATDVG